MWIGCTRKQLEDEEFKNKPLGSQWDVYDLGNGKIVPRGYYGNTGTDYMIAEKRFLRKMTPRLMLQLLGTECGRNIIHPEIWVNSLMADYKPLYKMGIDPYENSKGKGFIMDGKELFPNWVITDMRFPNEMEAIKGRNGLTIRVTRWIQDELTEKEARDLFHNGGQVYAVDDEGVEVLVTDKSYFNDFSRFVTEVNRINEHISETALDNCEDFDYVINNNERLVDLIHMVRLMLKKEKLI